MPSSAKYDITIICRTPLSWAAGNGHAAAVQYLVITGNADFNAQGKFGRTPLSWAASEGHKCVVSPLLDAKPCIDSKDWYGQTPLFWAVSKGRKGVLQLLIAIGSADINSKHRMYCQTPLSRAAQNGHDTVVKLLLQAGADIESKDIDGHTPLSMAAYNAIVKLLKSHPSRPLSRYEPLDAYIKTAATPLRMEHTNNMYIVDNGSAKMIAEMGTAPRGREYREPLLKERSNYHPSGLSSLPRDIDEDMFSYMDAAVIYRNTEPRWRPRRGCVDRGSRRPSSVIEPFGPSSQISRDKGPPPSTRGFQRLNSDQSRTSSVRDLIQWSSLDRPGNYESYGGSTANAISSRS
jgi:hypothetical protein